MYSICILPHPCNEKERGAVAMRQIRIIYAPPFNKNLVIKQAAYVFVM